MGEAKRHPTPRLAVLTSAWGDERERRGRGGVRERGLGEGGMSERGREGGKEGWSKCVCACVYTYTHTKNTYVHTHTSVCVCVYVNTHKTYVRTYTFT